MPTAPSTNLAPGRAEPAKLAYSLDEAAAASSLSKTTIKKLITTGQLRSTLVGGRRLVPAEALAELIHGGSDA